MARQRARQIAALLGFAPLDQTRVATAVSEIARNAFQYAGGGRTSYLVNSVRARAHRRSASTERGSQSRRHPRRPVRVAAAAWASASSARAADGSVRDRRACPALAPRSRWSRPPVRRPRSAAGARHRSRPIRPAQADRGRLDELQLQNQELMRTLAGAAGPPAGARASHAVSSRTPTGVSWPSMPSSTRMPRSCGESRA